MNQIFYDAVGNNPIIAAVKNMEDIEVSCTIEEIQVIFILFGDVCSIDRIVKRVKDAGKVAMVHVDLISGLSPKEISVEYLKEHTEADGIISTKPSLIKKAKELGMYTVLRSELFPKKYFPIFFVEDGSSIFRSFQISLIPLTFVVPSGIIICSKSLSNIPPGVTVRNFGNVIEPKLAPLISISFTESGSTKLSRVR